MSTLQDNLNLIKQEKDTKILPENIRKGVTIYNITGTMEGGTSGVKQFDSYANMQADPNPSDGDLATVYASTQSNFTESTQTQYITFPETVTLPSAVSDSIEIQLQTVDRSIMLNCWRRTEF